MVASSNDPTERGFAEHALAEPIWLWFDRPLWPRSVNRATIGVQSGELTLTPRLRYDPVRRAIRVEVDPAEVHANVEYVVVVRAGIAGWDGVVAPAQASLRVRFVPGIFTPPEPVSFRRQIAPALTRECATAGCHEAREPAMGLDLSSPEAIYRSTVGVAAREWEGSARGGEFYWIGMNRVETGAPGESFLVYKLLGDGPMRGGRMPRGGAARTELAQLVSDWIAAGTVDDR